MLGNRRFEVEPSSGSRLAVHLTSHSDVDASIAGRSRPVERHRPSDPDDAPPDESPLHLRRDGPSSIAARLSIACVERRHHGLSHPPRGLQASDRPRLTEACRRWCLRGDQSPPGGRDLQVEFRTRDLRAGREPLFAATSPNARWPLSRGLCWCRHQASRTRPHLPRSHGFAGRFTAHNRRPHPSSPIRHGVRHGRAGSAPHIRSSRDTTFDMGWRARRSERHRRGWAITMCHD